MRAKGAIVHRLLLGLALLAALTWNLAHASQITGLELSNGATGTRAEIALDRAAEFKVIRLSDPDRLVIDLPESSLARGVRIPAGNGVVQSVRTGQPTPGTTRVVFDLTQRIAVLQPRIEQGASGPKLVLEWPGDGDGASGRVATPEASLPGPGLAASTPPLHEPTAAQQAAASAAATTRLITELAARASRNVAADSNAASNGVQTTVPAAIPTDIPTGLATGQPNAGAGKTLQQVMRGRGMRPLIIAIDAGHGGQDPGAIGQAGKREKDITLAIARELARQVDATPGLQAYLTRDTDVFIPLNKRAQLARAAKADLFVSIHADAAENRKAKGSSVYVLSLRGASSQRARWLADKENAADLIGGVSLARTNNTLASVLLDLTQSGHMKASEDAAAHVLAGLKRIGNNHKPQIEHANFAVLRTSDMPAMLVETAFLSNPDEEKRLIDPAFQKTVARALLDGVNTYFTQQPPPGTMYAARAEAQWATAGTGGSVGGSR
ncbi:N-acetylmuramoyl-L-alanine amidase [Lysobacter sp. D1-1-M9]|uniref:N-acetylmuramoyl-L-alanine amidase n=1 Tax=Novilysobacter longmucuonensis TaxID=3098603 RepID=UPI002FCA4069